TTGLLPFGSSISGWWLTRVSFFIGSTSLAAAVRLPAHLRQARSSSDFHPVAYPDATEPSRNQVLSEHYAAFGLAKAAQSPQRVAACILDAGLGIDGRHHATRTGPRHFELG